MRRSEPIATELSISATTLPLTRDSRSLRSRSKIVAAGVEAASGRTAEEGRAAAIVAAGGSDYVVRTICGRVRHLDRRTGLRRASVACALALDCGGRDRPIGTWDCDRRHGDASERSSEITPRYSLLIRRRRESVKHSAGGAWLIWTSEFDRATLEGWLPLRTAD